VLTNCPDCAKALIKTDGDKHKCLVCGKEYLVSPDGKRIKEFREAACDWREYVDLLDDRIKLRNKSIPENAVEASAALSASDIVLNLSDLHLGSGGVSYRFFRELTDIIIKYKIPFVLLGDEGEGFFPSFRSARSVLGQVMEPIEQVRFFESWLNEVGEYLLCATCGNHDEFLEKIAGFNAFTAIKTKFAPYIDGIGALNLKVGHITYKIGLSHQGRGGSKWNKNHRLANIAREHMTGLDVMFGGHLHQEEVTGAYIRENWCWMISGGSIKTEDEYARRYFTFGGKIPQFSCVWLDDGEKRVVAFRSLREAIFWRDMVRANKKEYRAIVG